ncbi:C40 family peptidase [Burkholderia cenocepacia]|uniref:C40 family peptidase n=1 Tax=Burkholderia cenocepacia TaxID=95486 RepID=UPI0039088DD6
MIEISDLPGSVRAAIEAHAIEAYPNEACGLVVLPDGGGSLAYLRCANTADDPLKNFRISGEDYISAESAGRVEAVVHSHPGGRAVPSKADRTMAEAAGVSLWIIVSVGVQVDGSIGVEAWGSFSPDGYMAPLTGREFVHGVHDCYSIVRDWYKVERGVTLPDFPRTDGWWNDGTSSLYLDNYRAAGFANVGKDATLIPGDVMLMTVLSQNNEPNHSGVYVGGGRMIHHMAGRLSTNVLFGGMWQASHYTTLRYRGN